MYVTEAEARKLWCPFVRVDGSNRFNNTRNEGYNEAPGPYHCLGSECMEWRAVHARFLKEGASHLLEGHGYCGLGGRPDFE